MRVSKTFVCSAADTDTDTDTSTTLATNKSKVHGARRANFVRVCVREKCGRNSWGSDSYSVSPDPDTDRVRVRVRLACRSRSHRSRSRSQSRRQPGWVVVVAIVVVVVVSVVSSRSEPNAGVTNSFRKWKCARDAEGARGRQMKFIKLKKTWTIRATSGSENLHSTFRYNKSIPIHKSIYRYRDIYTNVYLHLPQKVAKQIVHLGLVQSENVSVKCLCVCECSVVVFPEFPMCVCIWTYTPLECSSTSSSSRKCQ